MARASTLNVSLTPTLRQYVQSKLQAGGYESASEVVRESLRVLKQRDQLQRDFWSNVRKKVASAKRQAASGDVIDGELAIKEIMEELSSTPKPSRKSRVA